MLSKNVITELKRQGFRGARVRTERMLNMRFEGTDTALMVLCEGDEIDTEDFEAAFKRQYKKEFGFLLETKMVVDDVKVRVCIVALLAWYSIRMNVGSWYRQDL